MNYAVRVILPNNGGTYTVDVYPNKDMAMHRAQQIYPLCNAMYNINVQIIEYVDSEEIYDR